MRYHSLSLTRADPHSGATVPADLRANGGVAVAGKHLELTSVLVVVAIEAEEGRDDPATCARRGGGTPRRTPACQDLTRDVPDPTEVSNRTREPKRTQRSD
jgi:hypothetical protein